MIHTDFADLIQYYLPTQSVLSNTFVSDTVPPTKNDVFFLSFSAFLFRCLSIRDFYLLLILFTSVLIYRRSLVLSYDFEKIFLFFFFFEL